MQELIDTIKAFDWPERDLAAANAQLANIALLFETEGRLREAIADCRKLVEEVKESVLGSKNCYFHRAVREHLTYLNAMW